MRRTLGHYGVFAAALLAMATWSGTSFGREKDAGNDSQSTAKDSSDDSQSGQNNNAARNQDRDNTGRNQDRDQSDDPQHHASLGISMVDNDGRVRVVAVLPGSPAARAGLQVGDEIRYVDDQRIRTTEGLQEEVGDRQPGATVELSIRRNGERQTLHARLGSAQDVAGQRSRNNRQYAANDQDNNNRGNRQYGNQNGWNQNGWNQNGWNQNGWNRNRASSYDPDAQSNSQAITQQLRSLRQQVAQLQQEVDELRNQAAGGTRVGNRNRSNNTSRDGNQGNDQD